MKNFYIEKFDFTQPKVLENEFIKLLEEPIDTVEKMEDWLKRQSLLYDAIEEGLSGHYIDFQCHSDSEEAKKLMEHDQMIIEPLFKKYDALLDDKILDTPIKDELDKDYYAQFLKMKENAKDLFREKNVQLEIEEDRLATEYFEITGSLTVDWNGEETTLSQLRTYFEDPDRETRKKAYLLFSEAFKSKEDELQKIMSQLINLRQKKADNADLPNYRDYMFKKYERFDYTPDDCKQLAEAIQKHVTPIKKKLQEKHKSELNVDSFKPWDISGVPKGQERLKPFLSSKELIDGSTKIFNNLDPRFAELITKMNENGMLDLDTRKGKAPGGFCSPLPVSELSFIFMNSANSHSDLVTLLHEMGHCIHNDFKKEQPLGSYKETPMESSELASMTMELFTMDQWDLFYDNEEDLLRAKRDQLKGIISFLPSGMVVDQFQHWLYENPNHTPEERNNKYFELLQTLNQGIVDYNDIEDLAKLQWLPILHIFEVPFYYIEYVIAQLGAVQMYKQYCENPDKALENYKKALKLGSSKSLPEVFEAAGIKFDFSEKTIKELMAFIEDKLSELD
ncbi:MULTISPECIES: M3 family oligoendopeptidase [Bacillaceae]|uniref:M3 family oligoendopeptidase n=1 Tax=Evansella alkalicola TaxID=745819 RepID=A0ABS6JQH2_9BACI|nr:MULTISPECIES: M3 family oligoendopeptidase [Bacillaceae]MBU9720799.1 M3 family oligoendopeptidase [Bacillus alkalicola]